MSTPPTPEEIARDARWLAQALDPAAGTVRMVEMTRESYRAASFLDDRMFQQPVSAHVLPWADVAAALPADARRDARWIFHIGHVGSTLIARLLGELPRVLAVREPQVLRDVAMLPPGDRAGHGPILTGLLSRVLAADDRALVKATSFVSEIAPELVPVGERASFLTASAANYIATILAGENSVKEMAQLARQRQQRMAERIQGLTLPLPTLAHLAAAAWACEATALEAAAERMTDCNVEWADFDLFLEAPQMRLARIASFFEFEADEEALRRIVAGPLMSRYSKALEYDYSPSLRRQLIGQATAQHRAAIADALAMLERAAQDSPLLARALDRSQAEH